MERYVLENENEKGRSFYTLGPLYEKIRSDIKVMEDEKKVMKELIPELEIVSVQKASATLPLLLKISTFLHNTMQRLEKKV